MSVLPPPEMEFPIFQKRRLIDFLKTRPTIVLEKPLIALLSERFSFQEAMPGEEIVKERWGKKLAAGIVDKMISEMVKKGITVPPEMREAMIDAWATIVTKGLMR
ncbi:MAG: hypothetical protein QXL22_01160 [Candidatus Nezhaarchaeales archaeon]